MSVVGVGGNSNGVLDKDDETFVFLFGGCRVSTSESDPSELDDDDEEEEDMLFGFCLLFSKVLKKNPNNKKIIKKKEIMSGPVKVLVCALCRAGFA